MGGSLKPENVETELIRDGDPSTSSLGAAGQKTNCKRIVKASKNLISVLIFHETPLATSTSGLELAHTHLLEA